jgi:MFS family permease
VPLTKVRQLGRRAGDAPVPAEAAPAEVPRPGPTSPLKVRAFRWLFATALVSNIGVWIWGVMGGYVMAQLTHVPSLVAALPVALALPGVIFALPAGAVADVTDLRLVVLTAKFLYLLGMVALALLAFGGALSPFALIVFAAWLGTVGTFSSPAYWSTIHQLVPERLLSRAFSLDGLQWNIGQVIGPVLGGALLAALGPGGMFAISSGLIATIVAFLYIWRGRQRTRLTTPGEGSAEAVVGAVAAGLRYLGNAPVLQVICWRTVLFVLPSGALTSLLPLLGSRVLDLSSVGYGLLLAAVGAGSVSAALVLPRLYERFPLDPMLAVASIISACSTVLLALVNHRAVAALALAIFGATWLVSVTTLNLSVQQAVPRWILSRALGAYLMVFQASIVFGGLLWGAVADVVGVRTTLLIAAGCLLGGVLLTNRLHLPSVDRRDLQVVPRPHPELVSEPEEEDGPVMIMVDFQTDPEKHEAFIEAMEELRVVRRRAGATRWSVFEDAERPGRFLESFVTRSWGGYLRQRSRYTTADLRILNAVRALDHTGNGPKVSYFLHPESVLAYRRRARWRRLRGVDRALEPPASLAAEDNPKHQGRSGDAV